MFTNRYFIAVGIPFILIIIGSVSKKLVKARPWQRDDFFLGADLSLAGISSGMIYITELLSAKASLQGCTTPACAAFLTSFDEKLLTDGGFIVLALLIFVVLLATHQDHERNTSNPRAQILMLGVFSNLVGAGLLASFILLVKGVAP
jgi:hypothetical protein